MCKIIYSFSVSIFQSFKNFVRKYLHTMYTRRLCNDFIIEGLHGSTFVNFLINIHTCIVQSIYQSKHCHAPS